MSTEVENNAFAFDDGGKLGPLQSFFLHASVYAYVSFLKEALERKGEASAETIERLLAEATEYVLVEAVRVPRGGRFDRLYRPRFWPEWELLLLISDPRKETALQRMRTLMAGVASLREDIVPDLRDTWNDVKIGAPFPEGSSSSSEEEGGKGKEKEKEQMGKKRTREEGEESERKRARISDEQAFEELNDVISHLPMDAWYVVFHAMGDWGEVGKTFARLRMTSKAALKSLSYLVYSLVLSTRPTMIGRVPSITRYVMNNALEEEEPSKFNVTYLQLSPFCNYLVPPSMFAQTLTRLEILDMDLHRDQAAMRAFEPFDDGEWKLRLNYVPFNPSPICPYLDWYVSAPGLDDVRLKLPPEEDYRRLFYEESGKPTVYPNLKILEIKSSAFAESTWFSSCSFPNLKTLIVDETLTGELKLYAERYNSINPETWQFRNGRGESPSELRESDPRDVVVCHPLMYLGQFGDECLSQLTSLKSLTLKGIKMIHGVTSKTWEAIGPSLEKLSLGPCYSYSFMYRSSQTPEEVKWGMPSREMWKRLSFLENHHVAHLTRLTDLEVISDASCNIPLGERLQDVHHRSCRLQLEAEPYLSNKWSADLVPITNCMLPVQLYDPVLKTFDAESEKRGGMWQAEGTHFLHDYRKFRLPFYDPASERNITLKAKTGKNPKAFVAPHAQGFGGKYRGLDRYEEGVGGIFHWSENEKWIDIATESETSSTTLEEAWGNVATIGNLKKLKFLGYFEIGTATYRTAYSGIVRHLTCLEHLHLDLCPFTNPRHLELEFLGIDMEEDEDDDEEEAIAKKNHRKLRGFAEGYCRAVQPALLHDVTYTLLSLKTLKWTHCSFVAFMDEDPRFPTPDEILRPKFGLLKNLERLSLKTNYLDLNQTDYEGDVLSPVYPTQRLTEKLGLERSMLNYYNMRLYEDAKPGRRAQLAEKLEPVWRRARLSMYRKCLANGVKEIMSPVLSCPKLKSLTLQGFEFDEGYDGDRIFHGLEKRRSTTTTTTTTTQTGEEEKRSLVRDLPLKKMKLVDVGFGSDDLAEWYDAKILADMNLQAYSGVPQPHFDYKSVSKHMDSFLQDILTFPHLEDLTLLGVYKMTDAAFVHKSVRSRLTSKSYENDPEIFEVNPFHNIKKLRLSFGKKCHFQVLKRFPNLGQLFLCPDTLPFMEDVLARIAAAGLPEPAHAFLDLLTQDEYEAYETHFFPPYWRGLDAVLADMKVLETLDLVKCFGDFSGRTLVDLPYLHHLGLYWCKDVPAKNLTNLPFLESLSLSYENHSFRTRFANYKPYANGDDAPISQLRYLKALDVNYGADKYDDSLSVFTTGRLDHLAGLFQARLNIAVRQPHEAPTSVQDHASVIYTLGYDRFRGADTSLGKTYLTPRQ